MIKNKSPSLENVTVMLSKKETEVSSKQDEIQLVLLGLKDPNSTFAR